MPQFLSTSYWRKYSTSKETFSNTMFIKLIRLQFKDLNAFFALAKYGLLISSVLLYSKTLFPIIQLIQLSPKTTNYPKCDTSNTILLQSVHNVTANFHSYVFCEHFGKPYIVAQLSAVPCSLLPNLNVLVANKGTQALKLCFNKIH